MTGQTRRVGRAPAGEQRFEALDALRAAAMLPVVVAHSALSYHATYIHRLLWAIHDSSRSRAFDALFWGSVGVAMPAFFFLSGFLAVRIEERKGRRGFVRDRARRIGAPFAVGALLILPPSLAVWGLGWIVGGRSNLRQLLKFKFLDVEIRENYLGPAHLWFLEYLIAMLAAFWLVRALPSRSVRALLAAGARRLTHPMAPIVVAVPSALILWAGRRAVGLDPVMDLRNSFVPDPFRWIHHAWFFAVGAGFYADRAELPKMTQRGPLLALLAVAAFVPRVWLARKSLLGPLAEREAVALAASGALFGWLSLFALLGLAQRWCATPRPLVRGLADRSYWVYLVHFPVVGLAQVALAGVPIACGAKFALVLGVTLGLGLLSFEVLVRRTWLAAWVGAGAPESRAGRGESCTVAEPRAAWARAVWKGIRSRRRPGVPA